MLCSTATELDGIPSWFLRVAAPIFCSPITQLFNLSLSTSTVPRQWKQAWNHPVPKVIAPIQHSDFRPISITPVLTRALERMIVLDFIYPALQNPTSLIFHDQFAFRPSGSTTAAIITSALSGTTQVSRYQKGKTNLDFTGARDSGWQWHQLGHMQVSTSLQTDNHASTPPLSFYRPDALPAAQPTVSKH